MNGLNLALKEWAAVCLALCRGEHFYLLRKGGVADPAQEFQLRAEKFLLFPTLEHQKPALLKPRWASSIEESQRFCNDASRVIFPGFAQAVRSKTLHSAEDLEPLKKYCIWSDDYVAMRLAYKPERPLSVVLLRAYRFESEVAAPMAARYDGCKSWVDLDRAVQLVPARPAVSDADFAALQAIF